MYNKAKARCGGRGLPELAFPLLGVHLGALGAAPDGGELWRVGEDPRLSDSVWTVDVLHVPLQRRCRPGFAPKLQKQKNY